MGRVESFTRTKIVEEDGEKYLEGEQWVINENGYSAPLIKVLERNGFRASSNSDLEKLATSGVTNNSNLSDAIERFVKDKKDAEELGERLKKLGYKF